MSTLLHVAEALSRPLLFHPAKLELILAALSDRLGLQADRPSPDASRFAGRPSEDRAYRIESGIAIVSIVGSLANRGAYIGASSGVVSYEGIAEQLRRASADGSVRGILLDINSGGGEATGMFRLAAQIRQIREAKRVVAFVDDVAASAAYGIASSAHEIVVSPTSIVGSIGVVLAHVDRSGELAAKGQRVTLIHAGANKVDGHPFGPLSDQVRADLQAEVGAFYEQFVATVAAGRPRLSPEAIRATEARTFIGRAAIDVGLADRIASLEDVIASFNSPRNAPQQRNATVGAHMSNNAASDAAERNRIAGILQSEEGRKRPGAARVLAEREDRVSVASATQLLARLPVEVGATPGRDAPSSDDALAALGPSARHAFEQSIARDNPKPKSGLLKAAEEMGAVMMANVGGASSPAPAGSSQRPKNGLEAAICEEFARASGLPPR